MKALLVSALFLVPAIASANNLPMKQIKQDIQSSVGRYGKVNVRGNTWKLSVPNGPVFLVGGRKLEVKATGIVNRSTGAVTIKYNNPAAGNAL